MSRTIGCNIRRPQSTALERARAEQEHAAGSRGAESTSSGGVGDLLIQINANRRASGHPPAADINENVNSGGDLNG